MIVETTGIADPGPILQTFYFEPAIEQQYQISSVITVVHSRTNSYLKRSIFRNRKKNGWPNKRMVCRRRLIPLRFGAVLARNS
ncbi:GTP-binding protein [Exiguobacterium antarcticum]|uniref:GTP-binding protein n=1 Tax=Exiguobacterium antarcticum TaxID=132920 RepID=UPI0013145B0F